ncbi:MAG: hypothetical protein KC729_11565, partial [Candidatus Eisenbacteria bacterium]|nr:hypothetical protein [Candidatus Eisenbacteria bacterium]
MEAIRPQIDTPVTAPQDRWNGIVRPYSQHDVEKLRGSVRIEHTLARIGACRLWDLLTSRDYVHALGALSGNQAVQMVRAGLQAIYCSGWQVAADANLSGQTYPDQSLYPANSVPAMVKRINAALQRADQIEHAERIAALLENGHGPANGNGGGNGNGAALGHAGGNGNGAAHGHAGGNGNGAAHGHAGANGNGAPQGHAVANGTGVHGGHGAAEHSWFAPIVADAEAGFGGP